MRRIFKTKINKRNVKRHKYYNALTPKLKPGLIIEFYDIHLKGISHDIFVI